MSGAGRNQRADTSAAQPGSTDIRVPSKKASNAKHRRGMLALSHKRHFGPYITISFCAKRSCSWRGDGNMAAPATWKPQQCCTACSGFRSVGGRSSPKGDRTSLCVDSCKRRRKLQKHSADAPNNKTMNAFKCVVLSHRVQAVGATLALHGLFENGIGCC